MARTVVVDQDECMGCESCVELCPEVFAMDDDGKAYVLDVENPSEDDVQEAIDACPAECITWEG